MYVKLWHNEVHLEVKMHRKGAKCSVLMLTEGLMVI